MKNLIATLALMLLAIYCAGNLNYLGACKDAANSDGTDSAIAETLINRGFSADHVFEDPTELEKVTSIFR